MSLRRPLVRLARGILAKSLIWSGCLAQNYWLENIYCCLVVTKLISYTWFVFFFLNHLPLLGAFPFINPRTSSLVFEVPLRNRKICDCAQTVPFTMDVEASESQNLIALLHLKAVFWAQCPGSASTATKVWKDRKVVWTVGVYQGTASVTAML